MSNENNHFTTFSFSCINPRWLPRFSPFMSNSENSRWPLYTGVKKITCPGAQDKLNFRQDKHIFSPNVLRTSKKITDSLFFLDKDKLIGNRTSKYFDVLARGTSENF